MPFSIVFNIKTWDLILIHFLQLTTKGWKTGQPHKIEIWFVEYENKYYIMSETMERAHWVQNIIHD